MDRALETVQLFGSLFVTLLLLFIPITVGIALLRRWIGPARLQRWLGGRRLPVALAKGTALGAVTPFCGCSTIPLLLGLLKADVRVAAVAAFTLASPLLNPYILGVVALLFGWQVSIAYALVAVVTTLVLATAAEYAGVERHLKIAGYRPGRTTERLDHSDATVASSPPDEAARPIAGGVGAERPILAPGLAGRDGADGVDRGACGGEAGADGSACGTAADDDGVGVDAADDEPAWRGVRTELHAAWGEMTALLRPMILPLVLGMGIGALIYGAVPQDAFADVLGTSSWVTLPLAALLGLPLYLRGEAAFPIGAGLLAAGVGEGPMFAMVIAGMGASIPEVTILSGIFNRRLLGIFLAAVFGMAIVGGAVIPLLS